MRTLLLRMGVSSSLALSAMLAVAGPASADPNPTPGLPVELDTKLNTLLGAFMALVIFACVAGVLMVAGKMALSFRRGEGGEAAGQLGFVMAACVLVGSASSLVLWIM